ncbi:MULTISPECIES: hypothetical protein [unclassified Kosakonia]|uniref:hypothetical protein n=1 Tax=unclassified Kosakonia TaxID=2632876 RepID=UPI001983DB3A|nr:hypothetical protein [Salmonella enterica]EJU8236892.1 hypothetical protein [Salmonella enterica]
MFNILRELTNIQSVSKHECNTMDYIREVISTNRTLNFEQEPDYLYVRNEACVQEKMCYIIHVDEVGFEVGDAIADNILELKLIGFIPKSSYWFTDVHDVNNNYIGYIAPKIEASLYNGNDDDLVIVLPNSECANNLSKNTPLSLPGTLSILNDMIIGKGLDNKIGVAVIIFLIDEIIDSGASILFTTKEEIGMTRYPDSIFDISCLVVIDAYTTTEEDCFLYEGPVVDGDNITLNNFTPFFEKNGLRFQKTTHDTKTGTEIDFIIRDERYKNNSFLMLLYPLSNMHTPKEKVSQSDCNELIKAVRLSVNHLMNLF